MQCDSTYFLHVSQVLYNFQQSMVQYLLFWPRKKNICILLNVAYSVFVSLPQFFSVSYRRVLISQQKYSQDLSIKKSWGRLLNSTKKEAFHKTEFYSLKMKQCQWMSKTQNTVLFWFAVWDISLWKVIVKKSVGNCVQNPVINVHWGKKYNNLQYLRPVQHSY